MGREILIVTGNIKKLEELKAIFGDKEITFLTLEDFPPIEIKEEGRTFFENAYIKAYKAAKEFDIVALGEDSGLVVDVLDGKPGVYSRRFAGENATDGENNRLLLSLLKDYPLSKRTAHFISCIVVCKPDGSYISSEGIVDGVIGFEPKGDNGFGYDPIFYYPPLSKTFAELNSVEKNEVSHRKKAIINIKNKLLQFIEND